VLFVPFVVQAVAILMAGRPAHHVSYGTTKSTKDTKQDHKRAIPSVFLATTAIAFKDMDSGEGGFGAAFACPYMCNNAGTFASDPALIASSSTLLVLGFEFGVDYVVSAFAFDLAFGGRALLGLFGGAGRGTGGSAGGRLLLGGFFVEDLA